MELTHVHGHPNPVDDNISVALDEVTVHQRQGNQEFRPLRQIARQRSRGVGLCLWVTLRKPGRWGREGPCIVDIQELLLRRHSISGKRDVDQVQKEFGRVHVHRQGMIETLKVSLHARDRAAVAESSLGQKVKLVEQVKGRGRWLMDARNDNDLEPCYSRRLAYLPAGLTLFFRATSLR